MTCSPFSPCSTRLRARYVGDASTFMDPFGSEATQLTCPRCSARLLSHTHADITVEWCQACRGLYLGDAELPKIVAWRRANLAGQLKKVGKDAAKETGRAVAKVGYVVIVNAALDALFGGILPRR